MSTSAQDEFNALYNNNQGQKLSGHPDDRSESSDNDSTTLNSGNDDEQTLASNTSAEMPAAATYLPTTTQFDANTGPKGVIADARSFETAKKRSFRQTIYAFSSDIVNNKKINFTHEKSKSPSPDLSENDEEDDFMRTWREKRLGELASGNQGIRTRRQSPSQRRYGSLVTVDPIGYLDAIEKVATYTTVVVFIYDDESSLSGKVEDALKDIARRHATTRFVKMHFLDAEMEEIAAPGILAYKGGDCFANLVSLMSEMPAGRDINSTTLEGVLQEQINSVISFFATIAKLSITSAVGASISQSKWLWYRQDEPRPLKDLQLFDDASRGPWGAVSLLMNIKARHLTFVGSIIIAMMLLFDPFLQQVVVYPDRLVASDKVATIVRAQSKCLNVTSSVEKRCNDSGCYELFLPGGPSLSGFGGQINSSISQVSTDLDDIEASVVRFSSLFSKRMNDSDDVQAWECALLYCVNTYFASVTDGDIDQRIEKTWRNNSASHSQGSDLIYNPPQSIINITANASTFKVASVAANAMNSFMSETFTGSGGINSSSSGSAFSSDIIHALYNTRNYSKTIENLATSMTNNIRQQKDSDSSTFEGVAYKTETYVHVRWAWFFYPATVLALSLLYLLGTIIESRNRDILIWKSSNLALLLHGQDLELSNSDRVPVNRLSEMNEMAKDIEIELIQTSDEDWKLVQR
ncbi:hypothetical protein HO133_001228 [Letharia lupina]|uniref:Phosducin domain-containing protein n=1 Tax=Letharia lupina TaxID=560253 RepID=A0A8H6FBB2_9LECA|nr:uncharacterized protein HO133_001228 [Letharia lupina]KAF6222142.1 hypothetical protein HO133_001228 [Letharia lupina]